MGDVCSRRAHIALRVSRSKCDGVGFPGGDGEGVEIGAQEMICKKDE